MFCENAGPLLVEYQRNALAATEQAALAAHLQQCAQCSRELAALQQLGSLLDREQQPSPQARARFMVQLRQETQRADNVRPALLVWLQQWWAARPLGAFSYSAALVVAGVLSGQMLPPHSLGIGPQQPMVESSPTPDRLIQLCAVPPAPDQVL